MTRRNDCDLGSGGTITGHSRTDAKRAIDDIAAAYKDRPVTAGDLDDKEARHQAGRARLRKRFGLPEKEKLETFAERITGTKQTGEPTFLDRLRQLRKSKK